jgi:glycerophosphoryl diester phosphodiesterase
MGAKMVGPTLVYLSPALLKSFHQAGIKVLVWTVDDPQGVEQAIDWGVDGVTTNHPELLDFARGFCR